MAMEYPDLEGAPVEGPSSDEAGQVAGPSLQDVLARLDHSEALWQSRFNDLYNGVQAITQREIGQIAARFVSLEAAVGTMQTKTELTHRLVAQGYDTEAVAAITAAVMEERRIQALEAKANNNVVQPDPATDPSVLATYWSGADVRLVERGFANGILSSAKLTDLVDAQGNALPGKEEELALYRSAAEAPLIGPATLVNYQKAERDAAARLDALGERLRKARTSSAASPPNTRPLGASTKNFGNVPLAEIPDDEYLKNEEAIIRGRIAAARK